MEPLWVNKTGLKQITLRYTAYAGRIGLDLRLFITYELNGFVGTKEYIPTYFNNTYGYCYDYVFECDSILNLTTEKISNFTPAIISPIILQIGVSMGADFQLIDSVGITATTREKGDVKALRANFTSSFMDVAVNTGAFSVSGGTEAYPTGDALLFDTITEVTGQITTTGATTGAKLMIVKYFSSGFGKPVAIATFTTSAAEVIYFTFSIDCYTPERGQNYLLSGMNKLYFKDLPTTKLIFQDSAAVTTINNAAFQGLPIQTYRAT